MGHRDELSRVALLAVTLGAACLLAGCATEASRLRRAEETAREFLQDPDLPRYEVTAGSATARMDILIRLEGSEGEGLIRTGVSGYGVLVFGAAALTDPRPREITRDQALKVAEGFCRRHAPRLWRQRAGVQVVDLDAGGNAYQFQFVASSADPREERFCIVKVRGADGKIGIFVNAS